MSVFHAVMLIAGFLVLATVMIKWMSHVNATERRSIERRRQAWIDGGCVPEDEPNFFSGNGGGSTS
jgi:hypothetical protein